MLCVFVLRSDLYNKKLLNPISPSCISLVKAKTDEVERIEAFMNAFLLVLVKILHTFRQLISRVFILSSHSLLVVLISIRFSS